MKRETNYRLDWLRAIAAFLVLATHTRTFFLQPYGAVAHKSAVLGAFYLATSFGHLAVMLFFVLSGYLIGNAVVSAYRRGAFDGRRYLIRRLTRLEIVLLPSLLLTLLWDVLGLTMTGRNDIYFGDPTSELLYFFARDCLTAPIALGNAAFLQNILVPQFGSNAPLWSLSYEFWYYLIFPLCAALFFLAGTRRVAAAVLAALALLFIGPSLRLYFLVWLMGVAIVFLPRIDVPPRVLQAAGVLAAMIGLAIARLVAHGVVSSDFIAAAGFTALIYAFVNAGASPEGRLGRALADMSYTLYLCHFSLIVFLSAVIIRSREARWQPDLPHVLLTCAIGVGVAVYCWLISLLTERHTDRVRRKVEAWFMPNVRT